MDAATQSYLSSLTGNLPKAVLYVRDVETLNSNIGDNSVKIDAAAVSKALRSAASNPQNKGAALTLGSLKSAGSAQMKDLTRFNGFTGIEVQYNPGSISLNSQSGDNERGRRSGRNRLIAQITRPVFTTMNFQLVFDDVNPKDAFMINSMSATGDAIAGISRYSFRKPEGEEDPGWSLEKKEYSVRKQVDGLVSLLANDATRQVVFFWAQMCFYGEVTKVNSRYTMFNPSGCPVRGVVDLTIRHESDEYEDEYWNKAFDTIFKI